MRNLKALSVPAFVAMGLMLIPGPDATAHEIVYTDYRGRPVHFATHRRAVLPSWLRQHQDFVSWYSLNYGHRAVGVSWHSLYRRYEGDYYYHRHYKARHKAQYGKKHYNAEYGKKHYKTTYHKKTRKSERRQRRDHRD